MNMMQRCENDSGGGLPEEILQDKLPLSQISAFSLFEETEETKKVNETLAESRSTGGIDSDKNGIEEEKKDTRSK